MALITCYECGKSGVSDTATSCPACGYNIGAETSRRADAARRKAYEESPEGQRRAKGLCIYCGSSRIAKEFNPKTGYWLHECLGCNKIDSFKPFK